VRSPLRSFRVGRFTMQILREGRGEIFDKLLCRRKESVSHLESSLTQVGDRDLPQLSSSESNYAIALQLAIDQAVVNHPHRSESALAGLSSTMANGMFSRERCLVALSTTPAIAVWGSRGPRWTAYEVILRGVHVPLVLNHGGVLLVEFAAGIDGVLNPG
jgi:hypothetical protein